MENKYYTPDISEFYVGFEYELLDTNYEYKVERLSDTKLKVLSDPIMTESWVKKTYNDYDFLYIEDSIEAKSNLKYYVDSKKVRVKYLDKEDIDGLGFKLEDMELYKKDGLYSKFNLCASKFGKSINGRTYGISLFFDNSIDSTYIRIDGEFSPGAVYGHLGSTLYRGHTNNKSELVKLLKQLNINE